MKTSSTHSSHSDKRPWNRRWENAPCANCVISTR